MNFFQKWNVFDARLITTVVEQFEKKIKKKKNKFSKTNRLGPMTVQIFHVTSIKANLIFGFSLKTLAFSGPG